MRNKTVFYNLRYDKWILILRISQCIFAMQELDGRKDNLNRKIEKMRMLN